MNETQSVSEGDVLWTPSPEFRKTTRLSAFAEWLEEQGHPRYEDYQSMWAWSVSEPQAFWKALADYAGIRFHQDAAVALVDAKMPGARWFPEATVNYAEHALNPKHQGDAVVYRDEAGAAITWDYDALRDQVARARTGLAKLGVVKGDRVVAYASNRPETLACFLAAASLGATWSSCAPEFGVQTVLDRFGQVEPTVLLVTRGYPYGGKRFDRTEQIAALQSALPTLKGTVVVETEAKTGATSDGIDWDTFTSETGTLTYEPVDFEHPLWILYSSGTTGKPKAIVQGHGGILLEHWKALALHSNLNDKDVFFWFTTTGWMMWNYLISGLCLGATVVLYDGSPGHPDLGALWKMAADLGVTYFGTSAPYLLACRKDAITPEKDHDLSALRGVGSTGAPLPPEGFAWVYENVGSDLLLGSVSGGSDVCTAFVLSCPWLPVTAGEIQCRGLGCAIEAYDEDGNPIVNEVGELVLTQPLPSMPTHFWGDADGSRMRASYFETFPGVWRHGDWVRITERGTCAIYGRSDATLNRGGVRMGTSEFYSVVDNIEGVADSLVIDTGANGQEGKLWLFLVLGDGVAMDAALKKRVATVLRKTVSPRHVPDEIQEIAKVPRTLNGKKMEVPIKKILLGQPMEKVVNPETLQDPEALTPFVGLMARS